MDIENFLGIGEIRLMDYDRRFDYSGMNLLSERYLIKNNSKKFSISICQISRATVIAPILEPN